MLCLSSRDKKVHVLFFPCYFIPAFTMQHNNTLTVSCSGNSKEQGVVINNTLIIALYIFVRSVRLDGIINEETFSLLSWDV